MKFVHKIFATALICSFFALPLNIFGSDSVSHEILGRNGKIPYATYNSCGGYVESICDQTIILEYKLEEEYDNNEFCVWVIRNKECFGSVITKMKSGFEVGYDYLQISGFQWTATIGDAPSYTEKWGSTTSWEQVSVQSYVNFLIFTTDNTNTGTGFRIEIVGWLPRTNPRWSDDFISTSPIGTDTIKPYFQNMLQSWLIAPKPGSVPSLVLNINYNITFADHLSVYTLERNGQLINFRSQARRLRGNDTAKFEAAYYTNYVVLFNSIVSQDVPDYAGITLNWHPSE